MNDGNVLLIFVKRFFFVLALLFPLGAVADSVLDSLYVVVHLQPNGDAQITEKRVMTVDNVGTECYTVVGNLDPDSHITDFKMFDENGGHYFTYVSDWDALHTRAQKTQKCGVVKTDSSTYCLCWGLGQEGKRREYWVCYTITHLVRSFADYDALTYQFVAPGMQPLPRYAKVIMSPDEGEFSDGSAKVWGKGYDGEALWRNGFIVASKEKSMKDNEAIVLLCRFEKGLFSPALVTDVPFSVLKNDFSTPMMKKEGKKVGKKKHNITLLVVSAFLLWVVLIAILLYVFKKRGKNNPSP